jgi:hypothetical protein
VEYLVDMKVVQVGEGNFKDAFLTVTVTHDAPKRVGLSARRDWSDRLGKPYLAQLRHFVHGLKDIKFAQEMQRMDAMMGNMLNNAVRNGVDPARMLDQRLRTSFGGR